MRWVGKGGGVTEPDRRQLTLWRMRFACWIPKAANTLSEYEILIVFLLH